VKPAEISGHLDLLFQYCGVSFSVIFVSEMF